MLGTMPVIGLSFGNCLEWLPLLFKDRGMAVIAARRGLHASFD